MQNTLLIRISPTCNFRRSRPRLPFQRHVFACAAKLAWARGAAEIELRTWRLLAVRYTLLRTNNDLPPAVASNALSWVRPRGKATTSAGGVERVNPDAPRNVAWRSVRHDKFLCAPPSPPARNCLQCVCAATSCDGRRKTNAPRESRTPDLEVNSITL